ERGLELGDGAERYLFLPVLRAAVIDALVEAAFAADVAEQPILLLLDQPHVQRIARREDLAQGPLVQVADGERGVDIDAGAGVHEPGRHDLYASKKQRARPVLVDRARIHHVDGEPFEILRRDLPAPAVIELGALHRNASRLVALEQPEE